MTLLTRSLASTWERRDVAKGSRWIHGRREAVKVVGNPKGDRHHVVSAGYQRFFADGERIQLHRKDWAESQKKEDPVQSSTRNCCVVKRFSSILHEGIWDDDQIERKWHSVEDCYLPVIRELVYNDTWTPRQPVAIAAIAALHFARSYGYALVSDRIAALTFEQALVDIPADPYLQQRFAAHYGRSAQPGEIEAMVRKVHDNIHYKGTPFRLERMLINYNKAAQYFAGLHVQRLTNRSTQVGFITGDTPVVISRHRFLQVGSPSGLALMDADNIYMPLSPRLAVMLCAKAEPDVELEPWRVQYFNHQLIWRAALRQVLIHPDHDLNRVLGRRSSSHDPYRR